MKRILTAAAILAALAVGAFADDDWYRQRDERYRGEDWRPHIFMHVKTDLDHVWSAQYAADRERVRLDKTKDELVQIQTDYDHGRWDNGLINDVIDSIRKSANDERLSERDRGVLADDVNRIHDFQARHNHGHYRQ